MIKSPLKAHAITIAILLHIICAISSFFAYVNIYHSGRAYLEHWYDYVFAYYGIVTTLYPLVIGLLIFLLFLGYGLIFMSITGDKL